LKLLKTLLLLIALAIATAAAVAGWVVLAPATTKPLEVAVMQGSGLRAIARQAREAGVDVNEDLLVQGLKWATQWTDRPVRAGLYDLPAGASMLTVLRSFTSGKPRLVSARLPEGATFRDLLGWLAKAPYLSRDLSSLKPADAAKVLGASSMAELEGLYFPDTYLLNPGAKESDVLRMARRAMDERLAGIWADRAPDAMVKSPREALILASIIEKETGRDAERPLVSAVFNNRLRIGMRLQTDPTVIYGLGERFDGNLRKVDLTTDTPWNSYTRGGLPPTPIALPSAASLMAAVQPAASQALYFVARGDGTSEFSTNLADHNRAVNRFQRGQ
jgi:UPF0755 protein